MKGNDMILTVYGSGCKNCRTLRDNAQAALDRTGGEGRVDYVTDMATIAALGILSTPALAIDGKVISSGRVLSLADITALMQAE